MKFLAITAAVLVSAVAAHHPPGCEPGTYSCKVNDEGKPGWQVCDVDHRWKDGGDCPPKTVCKFNHENNSPYCVPPHFHFP